MSRDDYGAISVISAEEREALGLGGPRPDEEDEGLFETVGKAADKIGETKLGQKVGSILTVLLLAMFGSGTVDIDQFSEIWGGGEDEPALKGGCMDPTAINYKKDADFDNGSCVFPPPVKYGCTDASATNYDAQATHDNGRCQYLNQNGTGNETQTNETVYGCMDIDANNYNDRATEDDGSCEYEHEENHCNHTQLVLWNGLEYGNYSREYNTLDIYVDMDTNCDDSDEPLPVLVYYDVGHFFINEEGNETTLMYDTIVYEEHFFNVSGWVEDTHWLNSGAEPYDETFDNHTDGVYYFYASFLADWNNTGEYEYVTSITNYPYYNDENEAFRLEEE